MFWTAPIQHAPYPGEKVFVYSDLPQAGQQLVIYGPVPGTWLTAHPKPGLLLLEILGPGGAPLVQDARGTVTV